MKKVVTTSCAFFIFLLLLGAGILWWTLSAVNKEDTSIRSIIIAKGETVSGIAKKLENEGIVRNALVLRIILRSKDEDAPIQAGTYELAPSMSVDEIATALLQGSQDTWVTLLEGWRAEEIADELTTKFGLRYFDPVVFLQLAKGKEGTLFPDTYLFPKQTTAKLIVDTLTNTFERRYQKLIEEVGKPVLSKEDTIVLASLIEREARDPGAMKIVAGILINRLEAGIPLQVDATLQYVKGYDAKEKTWWVEPRAIDKKLVSPFNTYQNRGLPPSAISNPGLNALRAAVAPAKTDYLYYISDTVGRMHYASSLEEHNRNVQTYLK